MKGRKGKHRHDEKGSGLARRKAVTIHVSAGKCSPAMPLTSDETDITMNFYKLFQLKATSNLSMSYAFNPNAAWDVDPAVGSGNTIGLSTWAALYAYYRVYSFEYDIEFANQDATASVVSITNTNSNPGVGAGVSILALASGNPYCKTRMVSQTAGGSCVARFRGKIDFRRLLGGTDVETGDNWRGLTGSTSPSDLFWLCVGIDTTPNALTNGCIVSVNIKMNMRLYDRKPINS